jgi:hypothetical protein
MVSPTMSGEVTDPAILAQLNGGQEVTDPAILSQLNGSSTADASTGAPLSGGMDSWLRKIALGGRAVAQGVTGTLGDAAALGPTGLVNAATGAVNMATGTKIPPLQLPSNLLQTLFTRAGTPTPQTGGEQLASAGIRGLAGGLGGGAAFGHRWNAKRDSRWRSWR